MILRKNVIITLTCFVLLLGLVYTNFAGNAYAHTTGPCDCSLDSVTIEHDGQRYASGEEAHYFSASTIDFLVTSYSSVMTLKENVIIGDRDQQFTFPGEHIVVSYYSFDNSNWKSIENLAGFKVPVGDNDDLYFKFTLDSYEVTDTQAAYMHFTRASGVKNISVDPSTLPAAGGNVKVTVNGHLLPPNLEVRVYDPAGNDLGIISTPDKNTNTGLKSIKSVPETFTVSLPANTTDKDQVYTIRAVVDGDWLEPGATVTVLAQALHEDNQDDKGSSNGKNGDDGGKTGDDEGYTKFILIGLAAVLFIYLALTVKNARRRRA